MDQNTGDDVQAVKNDQLAFTSTASAADVATVSIASGSIATLQTSSTTTTVSASSVEPPTALTNVAKSIPHSIGSSKFVVPQQQSTATGSISLRSSAAASLSPLINSTTPSPQPPPPLSPVMARFGASQLKIVPLSSGVASLCTISGSKSPAKVVLMSSSSSSSSSSSLQPDLTVAPSVPPLSTITTAVRTTPQQSVSVSGGDAPLTTTVQPTTLLPPTKTMTTPQPALTNKLFTILSSPASSQAIGSGSGSSSVTSTLPMTPKTVINTVSSSGKIQYVKILNTANHNANNNNNNNNNINSGGGNTNNAIKITTVNRSGSVTEAATEAAFAANRPGIAGGGGGGGGGAVGGLSRQFPSILSAQLSQQSLPPRPTAEDSSGAVNTTSTPTTTSAENRTETAHARSTLSFSAAGSPSSSIFSVPSSSSSSSSSSSNNTSNSTMLLHRMLGVSATSSTESATSESAAAKALKRKQFITTVSSSGSSNNSNVINSNSSSSTNVMTRQLVQLTPLAFSGGGSSQQTVSAVTLTPIANSATNSSLGASGGVGLRRIEPSSALTSVLLHNKQPAMQHHQQCNMSGRTPTTIVDLSNEEAVRRIDDRAAAHRQQKQQQQQQQQRQQQLAPVIDGVKSFALASSSGPSPISSVTTLNSFAQQLNAAQQHQQQQQKQPPTVPGGSSSALASATSAPPTLAMASVALSSQSAYPPPSSSSSSSSSSFLTTSNRKPCNCTKSMCLKLYCDCFAMGSFCHDCNCLNCYNTLEHEDERNKAIRLVLERNPQAFQSKIAQLTLAKAMPHQLAAATAASAVSTENGSGGATTAATAATVAAHAGTDAASSSDTDTTATIAGAHVNDELSEIQSRHIKGCNCRKSNCLKRYCECYLAKIQCSTLCKCIGCKNCDDTTKSALRSIRYESDLSKLNQQQHQHLQQLNHQLHQSGLFVGRQPLPTGGAAGGGSSVKSSSSLSIGATAAAAAAVSAASCFGARQDTANANSASSSLLATNDGSGLLNDSQSLLFGGGASRFGALQRAGAVAGLSGGDDSSTFGAGSSSLLWRANTGAGAGVGRRLSDLHTKLSRFGSSSESRLFANGLSSSPSSSSSLLLWSHQHNHSDLDSLSAQNKAQLEQQQMLCRSYANHVSKSVDETCRRLIDLLAERRQRQRCGDDKRDVKMETDQDPDVRDDPDDPQTSDTMRQEESSSDQDDRDDHSDHDDDDEWRDIERLLIDEFGKCLVNVIETAERRRETSSTALH